GRVAARDERLARCGDAAERFRGGSGGRDAGGVRRGPHQGEPAGGERTAEQGVPRPDEQPLLERRRVSDHDVQVAVRGGAQDLPRWGDHGGQGSGARPERLEHRERARLLYRVRGTESEGRGRGRAGAAGGGPGGNGGEAERDGT